MTLVQRCAVATADSKLGGLIDKLVALRAEIDATLAELAAHAEAQHADGADTSTVAAAGDDDETSAETVSEPRVPARAAEAPAIALIPAADLQSNCREATGDARPELNAPATDRPGDAVQMRVALFAQAPIEASLVSAVAVAAAADLGRAAHPDAIPATAKDDLTLLASVDAELAARLNAHGIASFAQIAAWSEADVKAISEALDIGRRISKENWIEQAALLAKGATTAFATRREAAPIDGADIAQVADALPADTPAATLVEASPATITTTAVTPERTESAQIIVFDPGMRRAKEAATASSETSGHPRARARRRAGTIVLTTLAASLLAAVALATDSGAFSEARAAVSQSFRQLLERGKTGAPIDTTMLAPYMRPQVFHVPVPHPSAEFDLLLRHRQSWPPGS